MAMAIPTLSAESLASFRERLTVPWTPIEVARVNESVIRMALMDGEFPWHHHAEDEMFLGYEGEASGIHPDDLVADALNAVT